MWSSLQAGGSREPAEGHSVGQTSPGAEAVPAPVVPRGLPGRSQLLALRIQGPLPSARGQILLQGIKSREQLGTALQTTGIQRFFHPPLPFFFCFNRNWLLL